MYVMGDVHGHYETLLRLLREAGLIDANLAWSGGPAVLWFVGDYVDRGPDGIGTIELVMRLQGEARAAGGQVGALLGNHDALLLSARRLGTLPTQGPGGTFIGDWQRYGESTDLARLSPEHAAWLAALPAMARAGEHLLVHADAMFYLNYGGSVDEVNAAFATLLAGDDAAAWDRLLGDFSERDAFLEGAAPGRTQARRFLETFGGQRIIHGHTPIGNARGVPASEVRGAYVYAADLCVNVDGGIYAGGAGFVYRAPAAEPAARRRPARARSAAARAAAQESSAAADHFELSQLGEGVYAAIAVEGGGAQANAGIVDLGDRTLIFDTFLTPQAARALRDTAEQLTGRAPLCVVNSHWHADHMRGNSVFAPEAEIYATPVTRELIATKGAERLKFMRATVDERLRALEAQLEAENEETRRKALATDLSAGRQIAASLPHAELRLPNRTFEGRIHFYGPRRSARLLSFGGGHTQSDVVLYLPDDGIAFMGDLFFGGERAWHPWLGDGDPDGWLRTLECIEALGARVLLPGHGRAGSVSDLAAMRAYISALQSLAAEVRARGGSADDAAALAPPSGFAVWGAVEIFARNMRFLFERQAGAPPRDGRS